jgi:hypothetical protein
MSGIGFDYEFLRPRAAMLSPPRCQLAVPSLPAHDVRDPVHRQRAAQRPAKAPGNARRSLCTSERNPTSVYPLLTGACTHKTRLATRPLCPPKANVLCGDCMSALCQQRSCRQCAIDFPRAPENFRNGGCDVSFLAVSGIQMIYLATFVELPNEPVPSCLQRCPRR